MATTYTDTAGENLVAQDLCYRSTDGKLYKAMADVATTMPAIAFAAESIDAAATGLFHSRGKVVLTAHGLGLTNSLLFVSQTTAGLITSLRPSGSGEQVQVVGQIVDSNTIDFSPNMIVIELA